jgi:hypothetical protein
MTKNIPQFIHKYIEAVKSDERLPSQDVELESYFSLHKKIEDEQDLDLRKLLHIKLQNYCEGYVAGTNGMLLSYILEIWDEEIEIDRESLIFERKTLMLSNLYLELEEILAGASDSSGYTKQYSSNRRYPIRIPMKDGTFIKGTRVLLGDGIEPKQFMGSHYSFGSHKFYAGQALCKIIDYLEQRYGIDFQALEKNLNSKTK